VISYLFFIVAFLIIAFFKKEVKYFEPMEGVNKFLKIVMSSRWLQWEWGDALWS